MATEVVLPQWGMNMTEGTIVKWLKKEGDPIEEGEPFAEIETEKIETQFESPASGVIAHILVEEGETVPVGTLLVIIAEPGEVVPRPASRPPVATATSAPPASPAASPAPPPAAPRPSTPAQAAGPSVQIIPAARRLAQEHGIDLAQVRGSGPGGRITEADVRQAIEARSRPAAQGTPLTGMRRAIADRMLQSVQNMAQVTLHTEADVTELVSLRHALLSQWRSHRIRPLDFDLVIKATARALKEHPRLNATLIDDRINQSPEVNIGIATAVADGLIVPVIHQASEKSLLAIAQQVRDLADKARKNALSRDEVSNGTFTITNLGSYDIDAFTPIINPPQVAILGVGRIVDRPVVFEGAIAIRSMMTLSLTFDHRALDGVPCGEFLRALRRYLEQPGWMAG